MESCAGRVVRGSAKPSLGPILADTSKVPAPYIKSSAAAKSHALPTVGKARTITSENEGPGKNDEGLHGVCVHQCRQPSCNKPGSTEGKHTCWSLAPMVFETKKSTHSREQIL